MQVELHIKKTDSTEFVKIATFEFIPSILTIDNLVKDYCHLKSLCDNKTCSVNTIREVYDNGVSYDINL